MEFYQSLYDLQGAFLNYCPFYRTAVDIRIGGTDVGMSKMVQINISQPKYINF